MVAPENRSGAYLKYVSTGSAGSCHSQAGLNANGNSKLGSIALEKLARMMNWSIFAP